MIELVARPSAEDDVLLLSGAARGDWSCIGQLYDRHRDGALAVAMSVLADPIDAEDVVHDVFMDLPRMARSYDAGRGRPEQWLCRSVRNRAIDHVRRRSRRQSRVAPTTDGPEALLALVPSRAASPADEAEAGEFLELLGRLDPRYAHLVRLAFVDGWSHSAIARITGIPLGTVKTRLRNSMRQIRVMLADPSQAPVRSSKVARGGTAAPILAVSADPGFRHAIARSASGMASVTTMTLHAWAKSDGISPSDVAALALDLPADPSKAGHLMSRLASGAWSDVPLLVRRHGRLPLKLPERAGMTIVLGVGEVPRLDLPMAVSALMTSSADRTQRTKGIARLLGSDAAVLAGDRLGRVFTVTQAAASLIGWAPRQLAGTYVTDLSATAITDAERHWQELVAVGQWAGSMVVRRPAGAPVGLRLRAWMVPSGGFIAVIALDESFVVSAA